MGFSVRSSSGTPAHTQAAASTTKPSKALERVLFEPADKFEDDGKKELAAKGALGLSRPKTFSFKGPHAAVTKGAKERDRKMDEVGRQVVARLQDLGWKAAISGAGAGPDVVAGVLPRAYKGTGNSFGEAYNLIDLTAPYIGRNKLTLVFEREYNEWTGGKYADAEAKLMLGFVDAKTNKSWGSGYTLDRALLTESDPAKVEALTQELVDHIVTELEQFQALNKPKRRRGVG